MVNKAWIEAMIEAFEERARICKCPFDKHKLQQEANNYRKMLKDDRL